VVGRGGGVCFHCADGHMEITWSPGGRRFDVPNGTAIQG
jgi:hypothetical protein